MGWRVAGIVAGTIVVLTLALVGYIWWQVTRPLDAGLVASHVKTFEGDDVDVDVKACEKTVGEAITNDDYGPSLQEVWRCDVNRRDDRSGFAESCYVVYSGLVSGIVRNIRCAAVGPAARPGAAVTESRMGVFSGGWSTRRWC